MAAARTPRRPGRPAGASTTRAAILDAALGQFAARGYTTTSIRSIAAAADVDPSLVTHYFKTKDDLLEACIKDFTSTPMPFLPELQDRGPDAGTRVARAYLRMWEDPFTGPRLRAVARAATESSAAAELLRTALDSLAATHAPSAEAARRHQLALSQLLGAAFARYILKVRPLAEATLEEVSAAVGPGLDTLITGN